MVKSDKNLIVKTLNGSIQGKKFTTVFGNEVNVFHRIPFIKTPIGELRFKDPQPADDWSEVLDGTTESKPAPQLNMVTKQIIGTEDAIYINAWTKNLTPKKLVPVMVWIHGGAFNRGSAGIDLYSPDYLLQKEIVFFSFNYRIGPLGFLSFDEPELQIPGNAGLKDQTMALKWIKRNAHIFGGDPENITVFGQSAGAVSVHYQMLSDLSKNLFHKAIIMSGGAILDWAINPRQNYTLRLAKMFGWNEDDGSKKALKILQNISAEELIHASNSILNDEEKRERIFFAFTPMVEQYVSEQCLIPDDPKKMLRHAWGNKIPLIIGTTSDEGIFMLSMENSKNDPKVFEELKDFEYLVPPSLGIDKNSEECKKLGKIIKQYYYGDEVPSLENIQKYSKLLTDKIFVHGVHEMVKTRVNNPNVTQPTFMYRFCVDSPTFNHFKVHRICSLEKGACHADDLSYIFKNMHYNQDAGLSPDSLEHKTLQRMVGMWTNFAITDNPNCSEIEPIVFEPVTNTQPPYKCLNIAEEISFTNSSDTERVSVWEKVWGKEFFLQYIRD